MTENEINLSVKSWLLSNGFKYKGVLNTKNNTGTNPVSTQPIEGVVPKDVGFGQVPVPDGTRNVLIDHTGHKDRPVDLIWVEAKGSGVGLSALLQGFARVAYACYHGSGRGLLACPTTEFEMMFAQKDFLRAIGIASERSLGLLDAERGEVYWL